MDKKCIFFKLINRLIGFPICYNVHVICALVRFDRNPVTMKGYDESFISLSTEPIMERW